MSKLLLFLIAIPIALLLLIRNASGNTEIKKRTQLEKDIESAPYHKNDYVSDTFDCSNMAGLLVDHLDKKGYNAEIVVVNSKISPTGCLHTFVIVDRTAIVEPTLKLLTFSEGKYGNYRSESIAWYIKTWDVVGVYKNKEDASKNSNWGISEFGYFFHPNYDKIDALLNEE